MDPAWVSIIIGIVSSVITAALVAAINYAALKAWMARREERERVIEGRVSEMEGDIEVQSLGLQKLDVRVAVLEERSPRRPQGPPMDFAR